jgi:hypothetical protein
MLFTLPLTTLEAPFSSSSLSDLEVQLRLPMLLGVVVLLVLFLGACKSCHTSLNPLVEIMAILTISGVTTIEPITLQPWRMANRMVKPLNSKLLYRCIMVPRQRQAMEELGHSNHSKWDTQARSHMQVRQLSLCKDLCLASH